MKMKLYEAVVEVIDGLHEYRISQWLAAPNDTAAYALAEEAIRFNYGGDGKKRDGAYWSEGDSRAWQLETVREVKTITADAKHGIHEFVVTGRVVFDYGLWTRDDVAAEFKAIVKREPTDDELNEVIEIIQDDSTDEQIGELAVQAINTAIRCVLDTERA